MDAGIPAFEGSYIVVADEDRTIANFVIDTLETDGHSVFWAYDGISAIQLALSLKVCDLVISNSRVGGQQGVDLIIDLRERLPWLSILYLANDARSTPDQEQHLPADVPILREPFDAEDLRSAVQGLLRQA
jgi:two-component system response regulator VicR